MTDFYSLLKQSIIERGISDSGDRDEIYSQARRAMIRQLWAFDPPLDEEEIDQRIGAFDIAVSDIEGDVAAAFAASADRRATPAAEEDERRDEPEPARSREPPPAEARPARGLPVPARKSRAPAAPRARQKAVDYREPEERSEEYPAERPSAREPEDAEYEDAPPRQSPKRRPPPAPAETYAPSDDPYEEAEPPPPRGRSDGDAYDEDEYEPRERSRAVARTDRWSKNDQIRRRSPREKPGRAPEKKRQPFSEQAKIRMLLGAIGACLVLLVAVGVFLLLPRRDAGVTVDIDVRREVSDAATAVRTAAQTLPIDQTFMLFDGRDPTVFETSPGNPVKFDANAGIVRVGSSPGAPGVKALIGPGLAGRLAGRTVRVTLVARASPDSGAAGMRFAYQSGLAISHWQTANLGSNYQAVAMVWRVPTQRTDRAGDLLLIEPGVPGDGTGADIKSIRIDLLAQ